MNLRSLIPLLLFSGMQAFCQQKDSTNITYLKPFFDFDKSKPLFQLTSEQANNTHRHLRFSAITGYREGATSIPGSGNFDSYIDTLNGTTRSYMYNLSIQEILTVGAYADNEVILEVKDPSKYHYNSSLGSKLEWMRKNCYCVELMLPSGTINSPKILIDELEHLFGVKISHENRMCDVLVLFRSSKKDKIRSKKNGEQSYDMKGHFNNISIEYLGEAFTNAGLPRMINETGYTDKVDLDLGIESWKDLSALRKALKRYDLELRDEKREMKMFVIRETKQHL